MTIRVLILLLALGLGGCAVDSQFNRGALIGTFGGPLGVGGSEIVCRGGDGTALGVVGLMQHMATVFVLAYGEHEKYSAALPYYMGFSFLYGGVRAVVTHKKTGCNFGE